MNASLERSDLQPVLDAHGGNREFEQTLRKLSTNDDLLRALARYVHFNSTFGGGVANLAGEIAVRQDLFRDAQETVQMLADRCVEVAADIFFAAVDEFDDRATTHRDTHRALAQATIKGAGRFFGYEPVRLNQLLTVNAATQEAIKQVREGYGVNQAVDEPELFRAIGFHLGSEVLADEEFRILDGYLRRAHPELVKALESAHVEINGVRHAAYYWIRIHTSVEADHFMVAVKGANRALQYYTGQSDCNQVKQWIVSGVQEFADVQTGFMRGLVD